MSITTYMSVTDSNNVVLLGETVLKVFNPFTGKTLSNPVELMAWSGTTEVPVSFDSGGTTTGRIVFDPFTIVRRIDKLTQTFLASHATGNGFKFVDLLVTTSNGADPAATTLKPFVSYRLGTVAISQIDTAVRDEYVEETIQLVFGQLLIGYQIAKSDGTAGPFAPTGWDRVRNVKLP